MQVTRFVQVGAELMEYVGPALYRHAHPGEPHVAGERCDKCAVARRLDTREPVLLWLCGGVNWSISRHDHNYQQQRMAA